MDLLTANQMRAVEQAAIDSGADTGLELMERAGRAVVDAMLTRWPALQNGPMGIVVLCGPGNNGGDGYVIARLLHDLGREVEVFHYGDPGTLPPDARQNYERWLTCGPVHPMTDTAIESGYLDRADLIVDAIFGTGLTRPLPPEVQTFVHVGFDGDVHDPSRGARTVAVDMPSGLHSDTGRLIGVDVSGGDTRERFLLSAALTVSFHRAKRGHYLADGPTVCGALRVASIGLEGGLLNGQWRRHGAMRPAQEARVTLVPDPGDGGDRRGPGQDQATAQTMRALQKTVGHKYGYGHALVLSGPMGRSGAARLAARGALRSGAGLVTVAAPGSAMMECATQLTAIMLRTCDGPDGLMTLLEDARVNALCLGPGLGMGEGTRALVAVALADKARAVVLDADALTSFADTPQALFDLLHRKAVLTPHGGEFARLFPDLAGPDLSKVDATRAAAARAGCTVLFKGPDTVIADQTGRCVINSAAYERAAPWLATAGTGDVLAGMIVGLLARDLPPMQAAGTAAWLHVEAARAFGPGLIAEDLPETLPQVFQDLGL